MIKPIAGCDLFDALDCISQTIHCGDQIAAIVEQLGQGSAGGCIRGGGASLQCSEPSR